MCISVQVGLRHCLQGEGISTKKHKPYESMAYYVNALTPNLNMHQPLVPFPFIHNAPSSKGPTKSP